MIFARFFILCEKVCEILIILCEIKIQIMENVSLRFIYDKNKRATSSKPTSLIVEVRQNGTNRAVYINTGIKLYPNQFSNKNGLVIKNHDKANMLMVKAKSIFNKVEAFAYSDECTSLQDVKNYNKTETYNKNVLDFMRRELRERNPTESVLEHHKNSKFRDRSNEILFIDARNLGHLINRRTRVLSDEDIQNIAGTYHNWRNTDGAYEDIPGFCASVPVERVKELDYVLTPGRYVGLPEEEDDFNFNERFTALKAEWEEQLKEEERLNKLIAENLKKIKIDE
jgi:type I restriction-modification system DNA methylase subunit